MFRKGDSNSRCQKQTLIKPKCITTRTIKTIPSASQTFMEITELSRWSIFRMDREGQLWDLHQVRAKERKVTWGQAVQRWQELLGGFWRISSRWGQHTEACNTVEALAITKLIRLHIHISSRRIWQTPTPLASSLALEANRRHTRAPTATYKCTTSIAWSLLQPRRRWCDQCRQPRIKWNLPLNFSQLQPLRFKRLNKIRIKDHLCLKVSRIQIKSGYMKTRST